MYADDLLLISSTCSDLRRMLRTVFSKPTLYNTVTVNTAVFFDTGIPRIPRPYRRNCSLSPPVEPLSSDIRHLRHVLSWCNADRWGLLTLYGRRRVTACV